MADAGLTQGDIEALFTRADGSYAFARWGRPVAPVVFGIEDESLGVVKGALEAVLALAGHPMVETDPELGANLMVFFFRDWDELTALPDLDRLLPDLGPLVARLKAADANQYRMFRFDAAGGIKAGFVFLRMDAHLQALSADVLALDQMVRTVLLWSDKAFRDLSPLAVVEGQTILRPEIAGLIRAGYDPVLPVSSGDPAHALRLFARLQTGR